MAHKLPLAVWAVWSRCHVHTDAEGKLAIFDQRKKAKAWIDRNAVFASDLEIRRFTLEQEMPGVGEGRQ